MIKTYSLERKFGSFTAVNNVNLVVNKGEIFGFIGSNGAGKTTIMRMLATLMRPTSGRIEINGVEVCPPNYIEVRRKIGFMPQNTRFNENLYPEEIIRFFCSIRDCDSKKYIDLLKELKGDFNKKAKALSPGNQKKLQLAIAMIGLPELIILDEPTAGLDPIGVDEFREIIKNLKNQGHTVFMSTHNLKELENLCTSTAIIDKGKVLYMGEYKNVYEIDIDMQVLDEYTTKLKSIENFKYRVDGSKIIAYLNRSELPNAIKRLTALEIPVYGVREQSLEVLYRDTIKGREQA